MACRNRRTGHETVAAHRSYGGIPDAEPVKPGQVIDPKLHKPVVGDYDLLGGATMKSKGSNVVRVPDDPVHGDRTCPAAT